MMMKKGKISFRSLYHFMLEKKFFQIVFLDNAGLNLKEFFSTNLNGSNAI